MTMDAINGRHFLNDQITPRQQLEVPSMLRAAYSAVNHLAKSEPILSVESAKWNKGRLVQWAVDLGIEKLIQTGKWPFDYRWRYFERPTGKYLEVRMSHSAMTVSQTDDPTKQPRNVCFRENKRLNSQWLLPLRELEDEAHIDGLPHILLLHGHQELGFAHFAIPHPQHSLGYIHRTGNLMRLPHEVTSELPSVEETDEEATMSLKEDIERWRRDHGDR
ncbi:hypothetical protein [Kordiimonas marina]|uniref:hypothetical protein n=1 Tax=Kordiimonas marina TaxID=2872312 RepID=UPI001FF22DF3|nr:hypothetical protein [Kordiimonas marina]MCJ9430019.1 hypothetical protein [Kordiimonas marina]